MIIDNEAHSNAINSDTFAKIVLEKLRVLCVLVSKKNNNMTQVDDYKRDTSAAVRK